eukprot:CAMPEP_0114233928 /NCGR_PEP_ID=MMETSP0058-20121206/5442_1 /TAXON_ID=36894 /ORGANISM="Pyramimonas parkeae, CCMP726" /LENGTH=83 /DNA_ID=CAMNT_0001345583 /DNA_START=130 /DNA_END=379 /DNA_ORIENTATION=-
MTARATPFLSGTPLWKPGQGANSALLDVLALDAALNENPDNILAAVTTYSERQLPEGEALLDLLSLSGRQRSNPVVGIVYLVW